jgi:hypothetical protein
VEHREVLKEDAVGKPAKGRKKWHRGRKQASERRGEPEELTRGDCGSQRKLAAACRKVSRRARVAWRKRNIFRKIRTWGNWESRSKLAAAGMRMTCCASGGTAQGARAAETKKRRYGTKNPEGTDIQDEKLEGPRMQNRNKGPRHKMGAAS